MGKKLRASKVFLFNAAAVALAVGDYISGSGALGAKALLITGAINVALRTITREPIKGL